MLGVQLKSNTTDRLGGSKAMIGNTFAVKSSNDTDGWGDSSTASGWGGSSATSGWDDFDLSSG